MKTILLVVVVLLSLPILSYSQTLFGYDVDVTKPPKDMEFVNEREYEIDGVKYVDKVYKATTVPEQLDEIEFTETTDKQIRKFAISFNFFKDSISKKDFDEIYSKLCNLLDGSFKKEVDNKERKYKWYIDGIFNDGIIVLHNYKSSLILITTKYYEY